MLLCAYVREDVRKELPYTHVDEAKASTKYKQ
jgi:hypothetical protein